MGMAGLVLAIFTSGYILGVWAACLVLRQPQKSYEDGSVVRMARTSSIVTRVIGTERRLRIE
jgi:hypothetical protein